MSWQKTVLINGSLRNGQTQEVKKKDGSFAKCGRSKQKKDAKRKYPKCVPLAKARRMTESQRRSAVKRKRSVAQGVGGKPTNVKTFTKRAKAMGGGFMARRMGMM